MMVHAGVAVRKLTAAVTVSTQLSEGKKQHFDRTFNSLTLLR